VSTLFPAELVTDRYELTMADAYLAEGSAEQPVAFELSVRELPADRGYLIAAGLEQALEYLTELRFDEASLRYLRESGTCTPALCARLAGMRFDADVHAVAEGAVVYAGEPLLRVEGSRLVCQIVETMLLSTLNFQTLVATKASRCVEAAAGRPVVDFGLRRAHGGQAGVLAARAAYLGGCVGTATVAAGRRWNIPTVGTIAHSYVMGHDSELAAFAAFLELHPQDATLLIDTYDTLAGAANTVEAARRSGHRPQAVRLDSGNVSDLAGQVREVLDAGGLGETTILVSGDLDEYRIEQILAGGAPVDGFGVGTQLVTGGDAPALGGVYKLVESDGRPVMKTSSHKATLPGRHQVFRDGDDDTIGLAGEALPGRPLLEPVLAGGRRLAEQEPLAALRARARAEVAALPAERRRNRSPEIHHPRLSPQLQALKESLS